MRKMTTLRRVSQIFFLSLFVYILWSVTYPMRGAISPRILFETNPNIMLFTSIAERLFLPGILLAFVVPLLTLILGRIFCGWVCPMGTMIDLAGSFRKERKPLSDGSNVRNAFVKYVTLFAIIAASFFGIQIAWVLDPIVIMARFTSLNFIPAVTFIGNGFFIFLIRDLGLAGPVYDFYRGVKASVLGVKVYYFPNAPVIFAVFLVVVLSALILSRLWCRMFCPLGALYSILARFSLMERVVEGCIDCGKCNSKCRMGAINKDAGYRKGECVLCMECVYVCPAHVTKFTLARHGGCVTSRGFVSSIPEKKQFRQTTGENKKGITRKEFLALLAGAFLALGFNKKNAGKDPCSSLIRPPGALKEKEFLSRCVRCGNCMKICPTNVLQPSMLQSGIEGIWTPYLVNEIGYCEYNCALCGGVCPTGAIPDLDINKKQRTRLGLAKIDKTRCIAWAGNQQCLVCEEHCPVPSKAIKTDNIIVNGVVTARPVVDPELCIGCGICQNKCPITPDRAIKVYAEAADRG